MTFQCGGAELLGGCGTVVKALMLRLWLIVSCVGSARPLFLCWTFVHKAAFASVSQPNHTISNSTVTTIRQRMAKNLCKLFCKCWLGLLSLRCNSTWTELGRDWIETIRCIIENYDDVADDDDDLLGQLEHVVSPQWSACARWWPHCSDGLLLPQRFRMVSSWSWLLIVVDGGWWWVQVSTPTLCGSVCCRSSHLRQILVFDFALE